MVHIIIFGHTVMFIHKEKKKSIVVMHISDRIVSYCSETFAEFPASRSPNRNIPNPPQARAKYHKRA
ncbi:hypothetical protein T01_11482 [Trichinella spiralis]|uniref:Uncharacterized protein n=1 Tax=Trichinella spiralis TaxID=6334 RepID=A0A0V1BGK8_TRISP|nr:hypothetical protein T01_11482 [Trichinella spiralis]